MPKPRANREPLSVLVSSGGATTAERVGGREPSGRDVAGGGVLTAKECLDCVSVEGEIKAKKNHKQSSVRRQVLRCTGWKKSIKINVLWW